MAEDPEPGLSLPDINVLVALTNPSHQHHRRAHAWLATVERFATTPVTEAGLIRLLLNPAVTGQPVTGARALGILRGIRRQPRSLFLSDSSSLASPDFDLVGLAGHRQVTDFHLVNLAASAGAVLVTFDQRITGALTSGAQRHVQVL